jgi:hypothetical protein
LLEKKKALLLFTWMEDFPNGHSVVTVLFEVLW